MFRYRVFRQLPDHSFTEIAQTTFLEDAEAVYKRWHSGMISEVGGEIIQTKNLTHGAEALF
jgi:hypothetical protein